MIWRFSQAQMRWNIKIKIDLNLPRPFFCRSSASLCFSFLCSAFASCSFLFAFSVTAYKSIRRNIKNHYYQNRKTKTFAQIFVIHWHICSNIISIKYHPKYYWVLVTCRRQQYTAICHSFTTAAWIKILQNRCSKIGSAIELPIVVWHFII